MTYAGARTVLHVSHNDFVMCFCVRRRMLPHHPAPNLEGQLLHFCQSGLAVPPAHQASRPAEPGMLSEKVWQHRQLLVPAAMEVEISLVRRPPVCPFVWSAVGPRGEAPLDSSLASAKQEGQGRGGWQEESPEGCGQTSLMCCTSIAASKGPEVPKGYRRHVSG